MYTRRILLFRQCCWWNRNFHLFCKSDCKWQTHNCQMFKKRKMLKQCGRKVACRKVDTWIRRLQEDDSRGELGRKTRTWLDRENRKVILGILCVYWSWEKQREIMQGIVVKYNQRFAVHDQKFVMLWMTKDHIKFPSWE